VSIGIKHDNAALSSTLDAPSSAVRSVVSSAMPAGSAAAHVTLVDAGGLRWEVREDCLSLLTGADAPDWTNLIDDPRAERIKHNAQRSVWRIPCGGKVLYAKVYRPAGWLDRLKNARRGPASCTEWKVSRHAESRDLRTVRPVACGVDRDRPASAPSVFLTEELAGAQPLDLYWESVKARTEVHDRHRHGRLLIEALAELIAAAHRCGFWHHDLHAANLLVQPHASQRPVVAFVDLHSVRIDTPVSEAEAVRNLVQINQWFARHATRSERLRFLKTYLAYRNGASGAEGIAQNAAARAERAGWVERTLAIAGRHAASLWAKRDRRVLRSGKYFDRLRLADGWRGHAALHCKRPVPGSRASQLAFSLDQWQQWLEDPSRFFAPDRPELILKDSHSGMVCRAELNVDGEPLRVICKRGRSRTLFKRLWYLVRPSRPVQTFRSGHALLHRELPTAYPLVALERRVAGLVVDGLIITEEIPDTEDLDCLLRIRLPRESADRQRRVKAQLIDELVSLYVRMHDRGCMHRDMKAPNLLVQWAAQRDDPPRVTLVDLDGLSVRRQLRWPQCLRMIMRLNVSLDPCRIVTLTDRLRFLKAYLAGRPQRLREWKTIWRELAAASQRKRGKKAKRHQWKIKHYGRG